MTPRQRLHELTALRNRIDAEITALRADLEARDKARRRAAMKTAECGTDPGYYRHRRTLNEEACEACKKAHREYEATRVSRRARSRVLA